MNNYLTACKTVKRRRVTIAKTVLLCLCIGGGIFSVVFSTQISDRIVRTATATARTVLPSLFPFMVLSSFMSGSGLCTFLELFPGKLLEKTAHIKKEVTGAVVLGLISGFPIGATSVCELYKIGKINKTEAEDALCQAHNTGPAFPICFIGTYLWGSTVFGVCIYLSQLISMVLLSRSVFENTAVTVKKACQTEIDVNYTRALSEAVTKSGIGCVSICASVVFWKTVCGFFTVFTPEINAGLISLFEFSSGAQAAAEVGGMIGAFLSGFAVGFGGLAAIFQAAGFAAECGLSVRKLLLFKAAQGGVCGALTLVSFLII